MLSNAVRCSLMHVSFCRKGFLYGGRMAGRPSSFMRHGRLNEHKQRIKKGRDDQYDGCLHCKSVKQHKKVVKTAYWACFMFTQKEICKLPPPVFVQTPRSSPGASSSSWRPSLRSRREISTVQQRTVAPIRARAGRWANASDKKELADIPPIRARAGRWSF